MRRLNERGALRGLMLVWITLTHLPTKLSTYVNQPFGFVSAAEGFIFLSALFTGSIYFRTAEQNSYGAMRRKLSMRTLQLYLYHLLLLSFVFLVAVPIAASGTRPGLHNLLDFSFDAGARGQSGTRCSSFIGRHCSTFCPCTSSSWRSRLWH